MTLNEFRGDILDVPTLAKLMNVCPMTIYRHMKKKDPLPLYRTQWPDCHSGTLPPLHGCRGKVLQRKEALD